MSGKLLKILMQKCVKGVKSSACLEIFVLFYIRIILSRKHIKRATYMLIIWKNLDLNFSYFLGGMTFRTGFFDQVSVYVPVTMHHE